LIDQVPKRSLISPDPVAFSQLQELAREWLMEVTDWEAANVLTNG